MPDHTLKLTWILDGETHSREFTEGPIIVGRGKDCTLVINHRTVSRRHAEIHHGESGWRVKDLDSHNRTFVNGVETDQQWLGDGDRLRLGTDVAVFCQVDDPGKTRVEFSPADSSIADSIRMSVIEGRLRSGSTVGLITGSSILGIEPEEGTDQRPLSFLNVFEHAAQILHSSRGLQPLLEQVLGFVFEAIPAERGAVCLLEGDELVPHASRIREGVETSSRIQISETVSRLAVDRQEGILISDAMRDDRTQGARSIHEMGIRSAMCVPLIHEDQVAGIVYVDTSSMRAAFTENELEILSILALISSAGIVQTRLREEREQAEQERERLEQYLPAPVVDRLLDADSTDDTFETRNVEISALFADLVGFTTLCEELPARQVFDILNSVYERLTAVIFEHEGTLAKYNGDELVVFFGAPQDQEDHYERAVRTGLAIQTAMSEFNELGYCDPLEIRVGIDTGVAVVGDLGVHRRREYSAIGHVVNAAKRLQSEVAKPGQVIVGPQTREYLGEKIEARELAQVVLRGIPTPVTPWLVSRISHEGTE